jgi:diaminopimelate epimerase
VIKLANTRELNDIATLRDIGVEIKARYAQTGMNVTYYAVKTADSIASVTFERGVEAFTLSCGTGALAAARIHLGDKDGTCQVQVPGGELQVTFIGEHAILQGEARPIGWCTPLDGETK